MVEIGLYGIIAIAFAPGIILGALYLAKNMKRLPDIYRLVFKRDKCVLVRFRTRTNTIIERYMIPDEHGIMRIDGGIYQYDSKLACFNKRRRMHEFVCIENQFFSEKGELHKLTVKAPVIVTGENGAQETREEEVPQYVLSFANIIPKKIVIPGEEDEDGNILPEEHLGAKELNDFAESHVSKDIITATAQEMGFLKIAALLAGGALIVAALVGVVLYNKVDHLQTALDTANAIKTAGATVGR